MLEHMNEPKKRKKDTLKKPFSPFIKPTNIEKIVGIITIMNGILVATPRAKTKPQDIGKIIFFSLSLVPRIAINTPNEDNMIPGES